MKKYFIFICVMSILCSLGFCEEGFYAEEKLPVYAQDVWDATVKITAIKRKDINLVTKSIGAGVIVHQWENKLLIISVPHLIHKFVRYKKIEISYSGKLLKAKQVRVVMEKNGVVFLTCKINSGIKINIPRLSLSNVIVNQRIVSIGFPFLHLRDKGLCPCGPESKCFSIGKMKALGKDIETNALVIFHTADTLPGCSGGPLVNEEGEIIGIVHGVYSLHSSYWQKEKWWKYCCKGEKPWRLIYTAISSITIMECFKNIKKWEKR